MKILFLYRNLALGGVQARIALLSQALAARGHDVFVATYGKPQPVAWPLDAGVTHLDLGGGSLPRRLWRLHGHIGRLKPDVVISATPHGNLLSLGLKLLGRHRFFTILSEESDPVEEARHAHGIHKLPFLLTSQLYPLADRIVAVSQGVRDQLCKQSGMAPKRISVIYNPIYRSDIEMLAGEAVSHRWFGGNFKVFLAAGRFVEQKNLALLLDSFARVHTQMPEARLILIGDGPLRPRLERQVLALGIGGVVDMPGFQQNPFAWFAKADGLVLSSLWEGFGNVLVEAMACGCPVVSTDCPHGPAEILMGGKYGRLAANGDAQSLSAAMLDTLRNPAGRAMLRQRAQAFDVEMAAQAYAALLPKKETEPVACGSIGRNRPGRRGCPSAAAD
ncbi:MAG: hypothetical protein BGN83_04170 [Rhizobium sp. 63-7]|nr:MAG: hypothetical protein BGN83_04170 [Rhizobium sp. 63-7]